MTTERILKIIGVALGSFLFVRAMGLPWGLLAGVALALLFLA